MLRRAGMVKCLTPAAADYLATGRPSDVWLHEIVGWWGVGRKEMETVRGEGDREGWGKSVFTAQLGLWQYGIHMILFKY